jgi:hypothetical protein
MPEVATDDQLVDAYWRTTFRKISAEISESQDIERTRQTRHAAM